MYFVLDNVRSAWNVGAIMRTCDAIGAKLILLGYTPLPIGSTLKLIKKTAIGAENTVSWEHFEHFQEVFAKYPAQDFDHFGIEISDKSKNIYNFLDENKLDLDKTFLWLGNEIHGLEKDLIPLLKSELHLPMLGMKESLNVSSTMCTAGYLFLQQSTNTKVRN